MTHRSIGRRFPRGTSWAPPDPVHTAGLGFEREVIASAPSGLSSTRSLLVGLVLICSSFGCAYHPMLMTDARLLMAKQQYAEALEEVNKVCKSRDDVLCLLERGLLLHYAGKYDESNQVFDKAEILTEGLYTKSVSREAAAFVTSDLALAYAPKSFEQVLVNYFRALNYMFLGSSEDALVECRKASDKLAHYSEEQQRPYRHDAFIEYLTGILYEWGGETNNAFISYRNACDAYRTYGEIFGIKAPQDLTCDLLRTAYAMGFVEEAEEIPAEEREGCRTSLPEPQSELAKVVIFIEQGFVPALQEWSINMPILKSEAKAASDDPANFSLGMTSRMYGYTYDAGDVKYFLRVALPSYRATPIASQAPSLVLDNRAVAPAECEDIFAIAKAELDHDMPRIFVKTIARAIVKYKVSDAAGNKWGDILGKLVNAATAATEQADLRAWLSLPRAIYMVTVYVEPGTHTLALAGGLQASGSVASPSPDTSTTYPTQTVRLDAQPGTTNFVRFRQY